MDGQLPGYTPRGRGLGQKRFRDPDPPPADPAVRQYRATWQAQQARIQAVEVREDVHQRFLAACAAEEQSYAAATAWLRGLALPPESWRNDGLVRVPLGADWSAWGTLWQCPSCSTVYLIRSRGGKEARCPRCTT